MLPASLPPLFVQCLPLLFALLRLTLLRNLGSWAWGADISWLLKTEIKGI